MELIDREKLLKELKTSADHHEENSRDYVLMLRDRNIVREQPTVEAISKDQYENRLKTDMVAMLTEIQLEIEEMPMHYDPRDVSDLIQQKIDALRKVVDNGNDN